MSVCPNICNLFVSLSEHFQDIYTTFISWPILELSMSKDFANHKAHVKNILEVIDE